MGNHEINQRCDFLESFPSCHDLLLLIPIDESGLSQFWKVIMDQVNSPVFEFIITCQLLEFEFVLISWVSVVESSDNLPPVGMAQDLQQLTEVVCFR